MKRYYCLTKGGERAHLRKDATEENTLCKRSVSQGISGRGGLNLCDQCVRAEYDLRQAKTEANTITEARIVAEPAEPPTPA